LRVVLAEVTDEVSWASRGVLCGEDVGR
jgi:hypothetical protein